MTRFALFAIVCVAAGCAGEAQAQTTTAPPDGRYSAQFDVAATLGHKSDSAFGGEISYRLNDDWDVYFELGRMGNVATSDLDARARLIANAIGATASAVQKARYYDIGARYRLMARGTWDPYVLLGVGVASVKTQTNFAINGTDITGSIGDFGVSLGSDLSGTLTKGLLVIGAGVNKPLKRRYFFDGSLRYGHIFPKTSAIENDVSINTLRVQIGIGIKF